MTKTQNKVCMYAICKNESKHVDRWYESVKDADEIIVLQDGRVKERGTHLELLKKRGLYYSTYEAQYGDYKNALAVENIC